jgi:hypothetical protein
MPAVNTAPEPALERRGGRGVDKLEAIILYKTAMAIFKGWRENGLISDEELLAIDPRLAAKYGVSSCSIYREYGLIKPQNRGIYGSTKGDADEKNNTED